MEKIKLGATGRRVVRYVLRTLLVLLTVVALLVGGLAVTLNLIFNGPSPSARDVLTMSLLEASATKWIPGLFLGQEKVEEILDIVANEVSSFKPMTKLTARIVSQVYDFGGFTSEEVYHILEKESFKQNR